MRDNYIAFRCIIDEGHECRENRYTLGNRLFLRNFMDGCRLGIPYHIGVRFDEERGRIDGHCNRCVGAAGTAGTAGTACTAGTLGKFHHFPGKLYNAWPCLRHCVRCITVLRKTVRLGIDK